MGDLIRQGSQWLADMLQQHAASPVTYLRGETTIDLAATLGRTDLEVTDDYGGSVQAHSVDFLAAAGSLPFAPQAGDTVILDGRRFEVMNLPGEGCWRWTSPFRTTVRIHTKDTGSST